MRCTRASALFLVLVLVLSSCGLLGGNDTSEGPPANLGKLTVATITVLDSAPLVFAKETGAFAKAGIDVTLVNVKGGQASVTKIVNGEADISFSSYTPFFVARAKGVADIKIIADASAATANNQKLVLPDRSPIRSVRELKGKRIAITERFTMSHLLLASLFRDNGVAENEVEWREMGFGDMEPAFAKGQIDAAYMTEPYVTLTARHIGSTSFRDAASGPTADMPLTGYAATAPFIAGHQRLVRAFQKVLDESTAKVAVDSSLVERYGAQAANTDPEIVQHAGRPAYKSGLPAVNRIDRITTLMLAFKALPNWIDVKDLIAAPLPD